MVLFVSLVAPLAVQAQYDGEECRAQVRSIYERVRSVADRDAEGGSYYLQYHVRPEAQAATRTQSYGVEVWVRGNRMHVSSDRVQVYADENDVFTIMQSRGTIYRSRPGQRQAGSMQTFGALQDTLFTLASVEQCEPAELADGRKGRRVRLAFSEEARALAPDIRAVTFLIDAQREFFDRMRVEYAQAKKVGAATFVFDEVDFDRTTDRLREPVEQRFLTEEGTLRDRYDEYDLVDLRTEPTSEGPAPPRDGGRAVEPLDEDLLRPRTSRLFGGLYDEEGPRSRLTGVDVSDWLESIEGSELGIDPEGASSRPTTVRYEHDDLSQTQKPTGRLIPYYPILGCPYVEVSDGVVRLRLAAGDPYELGNTDFRASVDVEVEQYGVSTVGGKTRLDSQTVTLTVTDEAPEQVLQVDYATDPTASPRGTPGLRIDLSVTRYDGPSQQRKEAQKALFLEANLEETRGISARNLYATGGIPTPVRDCTMVRSGQGGGQKPLRTSIQSIASPSTANPQSFAWSTNVQKSGCAMPPEYQIQVTRLENTDPQKASDPEQVRATVDWDNALTVNTSSPEMKHALTLAQGTGYYAWRVRAIGSYHPGGIANARNWGRWSNAPGQGATVTLTDSTSTPPWAFYYRQFDDNKNWRYKRSFTETGNVSETMTYATGLKRKSQIQHRLPSKNDVVVQETEQDFAGRPALQTLPAPGGQDRLGYLDDFATTNGQLYTSENFDGGASSSGVPTPAPVDSTSRLGSYYSDANSNQRVPSARGYPFTRKRYIGNGSQRIVERSIPGDTHLTGGNRTTRTYYSQASDAELTRVFGDEAPSDSTVEKITQIDPNGTTRVVYQNINGDTLATALAIRKPSHPRMEDLASRQEAQLPITVQEGSEQRVSPRVTESTTTFQINRPKTQVTIRHKISPNRIPVRCAAPSSLGSCTAEVAITLRNARSPTTVLTDTTFTVSPTQGQTQSQWTATLDPGTYEVYKRVSLVTSPSEQARQYRVSLKQTAQSRLQPVYAHLQNNNLSQALDSLGVSGQDSTASLQIIPRCAGTTVPVERCAGPCADGPPDFEGYLKARWTPDGDSVTSQTANADLREYFWRDGGRLYPQSHSSGSFTGGNGAFNQLVKNMIADGYSCRKLWGCWKGIAGNYDRFGTVQKAGSTAVNKDSGILGSFLSCAGAVPDSVQSFSSQPYGQQGYLTNAHQYAKSPNPTTQAERNRWQTCKRRAKTLAQQKQNISYTQNALDCYRSGGASFKKKQTPAQGDTLDLPKACRKLQSASSSNKAQAKKCARALRTDVVGKCEQTCERRVVGFLTSLTKQYEENGYTLRGLEEQCGGQSSSSVGPERLLCQVQALIDKCKSRCQLTVQSDSSGNITRAGTEEEIEFLQKAMTSKPVVRLPGSGGQCPRGQPVSRTSGRTNIVARQLADRLNGTLNTARAEAPSGATPVLEWEDARPIFQALCQGQCSLNKPVFTDLSGSYDGLPVGPEAEFVAEGCTLYYRSQSTGRIQICSNLCQPSSCGTVCLDWETPTIPDSLVTRYEPTTCRQSASADLQRSLETAVADTLDALTEQFEDRYRSGCRAALQDDLMVSYDVGIHHYTLFYYDRSNNLVRTVSPKGVDVDRSHTREDHPQHTMIRTYTYNSYNKRIRGSSPDGGTTLYVYNRKGQPRFVQSAQQRTDTTYTYNKYDELGRLVESGLSSEGLTSSQPSDFQDLQRKASDPGFPRSAIDWTKTTYSTPASVTYVDGSAQRFLQNRVSYTETDDGTETYYSYDPHGNIEWSARVIPGLDTVYVGYQYDLSTGKLRAIRVNEGRADQFFHRFRYNADGRLLRVETSRDGIRWEQDAKYQYAKHGPLSRTVIGEDQVQGVDRVRTIHGWLKAVNHPSLNPPDDPGGDGQPGRTTARDAFGMTLRYYDGDFTRSGLSVGKSTPTQVPGLFGGTVTATHRSGASSPPGSGYRYDELGRLVGSRRYTLSGGGWSQTPRFRTSYEYDPNGNLSGLQRSGHRTGGGFDRDDLTLSYKSGTNQLQRVRDAVGAGAYPNDLDSQPPTNYRYDASGRLTSDKQSGLSIAWNANDRVETITKSNGTRITYLYNSSQRRVRKTVNPPNKPKKRTYYVRDEKGNLLARYTGTPSLSIPDFPFKRIHQLAERLAIQEKVIRLWMQEGESEGSSDALVQSVGAQSVLPGATRIGPLLGPAAASTVGIQQSSQGGARKKRSNIPHLAEIPLRGNERIGVIRPLDSLDATDNRSTRVLERKRYEIRDHLGNIRAVVGDRKVPTPRGGFKPDSVSTQHYYPYGAPLPGSSPGTGEYRYGFNGKEKDDEFFGQGLAYNFGARIYDARVGRWMSVDPKSDEIPQASPYRGMASDPINMIDPKGRQADSAEVTKEDLYWNPITGSYWSSPLSGREAEIYAKALNKTAQKTGSVASEAKKKYKEASKKLNMAADIAEKRGNKKMAQKMRKAADKFSTAANTVDKVASAADISADVLAAATALNKLEEVDYNTIKKNPQKAAKAFDKAMVTAGKFMSRSSIPTISQLGWFLTHGGSFFQNMVKGLQHSQRRLKNHPSPEVRDLVGQ